MHAPRSPLRNRVIVAAFLAVWGTGQGITIWRGVEGEHRAWSLFVTSAPGPEAYPRVDTDARFDADFRWNPVWERGDELVSLDGADLRGASATALTGRLMEALRAEGRAEIGWRRGARRGVEIYEPRRDVSWIGGLPLSIASATAAVMILLRAPGWSLSGLSFVLFACISIFALRPGLVPMPVGPAESLQLVVRPLCGAVAILIAARFPNAPPPARRWDVALAAVTFAATAGLYAIFGFGPFRGFVYGAAALLVCFGATMCALLVRTYRRMEPVGRRQTRWLLYGAFVALGALVFGNLAFLVDPPLLFWMGGPMVLAFAALPVGFLIAVFGYRFLDADPLISSATSYFLLGLVVLVAIETLIPQIAAPASRAMGLARDTTELALAIGVVFLTIPVHRFVRPRIERVFFPERPALEDGIHELLDEISEIEDRDRMIEHVASRLSGFLNTRTCLVFAEVGTSYEVLYGVGADEPPAFSATSAVVTALRERSAPLAADRLSRRDRIQQLPATERALLSGLGIAVVVPLRARGQLLGFACLGAKRSGDIYTSTELALLTAVANGVAVRLALAG